MSPFGKLHNVVSWPELYALSVRALGAGLVDGLDVHDGAPIAPHPLALLRAGTSGHAAAPLSSVMNSRRLAASMSHPSI
jgi:hypothetical protein